MAETYESLRNVLVGEEPDYTTADVLARMPEPSWWEQYVRPWGSATLAKGEPNWFGKNVLANPDLQSAMMASNFLVPGMKVPPRIPNPIRGYQGSPHDFAAERLVRRPDGSEEYLVGKPDQLPDVPPGYEVLQDFPLGRMRLDKIGTGEGAQAFGHGLYFAENPTTAQSYRESLAQEKGPIRIDGEVWNPSSGAERQAHSFLAMNEGNLEQAIAFARKQEADAMALYNGKMRHSLYGFSGKGQEWWADQAHQHGSAAQALESLKGRQIEASPGRLYEVNLHATPEQFLDWDKPLGKQSPQVSGALENIYGRDFENIERRGRLLDRAVDSLVGRTPPAHLTLGNYPVLGGVNFPAPTPKSMPYEMLLRVDKEATANAMNEAGIPGIRYLDQGSRSKGQGTSNYSVWTPEIIEILRKYGILAPAAAPALVNALSGDDQQ